MRPPTIADIARASGISRATIDRVLNGRPGVHERTREHVERAIAKLTADLDASSRMTTPVDFALQLDTGLFGDLRDAVVAYGGAHSLHELYLKTESGVQAVLTELCSDTSRPLVVAIKDSPALTRELSNARKRGKRIIALISDIDREARDAFVGIDNEAAGAAAAFLIGRTFGERPTAIGLVIGDPAYQCHADRRRGFRKTIESDFPKLALLAEAQGQDSPLITRSVTSKLLISNPTLAAIYNASGGNAGLAEAVQTDARSGGLMVVGHEANETTIPLLQSGKLDFVIAQSIDSLLQSAIAQSRIRDGERENDRIYIDFGIHTRHNIPAQNHYDAPTDLPHNAS